MDENKHLPAHEIIVRSATDELISQHGFTAEYLRDHPVTFNTMRRVLDTEGTMASWAVAYYMTGDRLHLPKDIMFEGLPHQEGWVDDDYLESLGHPAVLAATAEEEPVFLQPYDAPIELTEEPVYIHVRRRTDPQQRY